MSPSDPSSPAPGPVPAIPPEIAAIAVALAAVWPVSGQTDASPDAGSGPWRLSGRRWERPVGHRWS